MLQDFIELGILVDGRPLKELRDPHADHDTYTKQTRYVEGNKGQEFTLHVTLRKGFQPLWASYLHLMVWIDELPGCWTQSVDIENEQDGTFQDGSLIKDYGKELKHLALRNNDAGLWESCRLVFGSPGTSEETKGNLEMIPSQRSKTGSIRIRAFRAPAKPERGRPSLEDSMPKSYDELPRSMVQGREVKQSVELPVSTPLTRLQPSKYDYLPIEGPKGVYHEMEFLYRPRKTLISLGCIPVHPAQLSVTAALLERSEDMWKALKQRESEANAEILRLKGELIRAQSWKHISSVTGLERPGAAAAVRRIVNTTSTQTVGPEDNHIKRTVTHTIDTQNKLIKREVVEVDERETTVLLGGNKRRLSIEDDEDVLGLGPTTSKRNRGLPN